MSQRAALLNINFPQTSSLKLPEAILSTDRNRQQATIINII